MKRYIVSYELQITVDAESQDEANHRAELKLDKLSKQDILDELFLSEIREVVRPEDAYAG